MEWTPMTQIITCLFVCGIVFSIGVFISFCGWPCNEYGRDRSYRRYKKSICELECEHSERNLFNLIIAGICLVSFLVALWYGIATDFVV